MRRLIFMALAGVLCIFFVSAARAQRLDGTLRVTITDKSQASIEDAKVMAENQATGVSATTTTSSSGTYAFPNLLVGRRPIDLHNLAARVIVPQLKLCAACNEPESAHPNGHEFKRLPEWRGFYALRRGIGTALADVDSAVAAKSVLRHANVQTTTAHYVKSIDAAALRAMDKIDMLFDNGNVSGRPN